MIPTKKEAEKLLDWAGGLNPGIWTDHSKVVARAAQTIASKCGFDIHRAYVSGLLHDIGRYAGVMNLRHVYLGYKLMNDKGYGKIADICLSHSFPNKIFNEYFGENDCNRDELDIIATALSEAVFDEYDKLIQLCDAMGNSKGISLIDVRLMDVIRRYGFSDNATGKIEAIFDLKDHFDNLCGMNIYDLFYDEIRDVSFR